MTLTRLTVRNFRNFAALDLELPPRGVVIIGRNGQGKTNLLEAIYYLVLFRSFRGAKETELVRFGSSGFFVGGDVQSPGPEPLATRITAGYEIAGRRKKVTVDGTEPSTLADAVGRLVAVVLSPADRALVGGGPAERRRYLDVLLALTVPGYLRALGAMRRAVRQRNAALRRGEALAAWAFDEPLARAACAVATARATWTREHQARFGELCATLGERGAARMTYHAHGGHAPEDLAAALAAARERDLRRGLTTIGPHRDDLRLTIDAKETRTFGSAGQQRTAAIALRLLEAESLRATRGSVPLALFDDVFAELDEDRQASLLELIEAALPGQAIVTAPRAAEVPAVLLDRPRWEIAGGVLAG